MEDPTLFPPPPPPRQPPPPPPPKAEQTREEVEAEKRAFEEEIDRVIEDVSKDHTSMAYQAVYHSHNLPFGIQPPLLLELSSAWQYSWLKEGL